MRELESDTGQTEFGDRMLEDWGIETFGPQTPSRLDNLEKAMDIARRSVSADRVR